MSSPCVIVAVICDDVRHEQGEKESLMGLFTTFRVSDYQQPLPRFAVFLKLGFDEQGAHTVGLHVRSHEGDFGINLEGPVEALARDAAYGQYLVGMVLNLPDLKVPREGWYAVIPAPERARSLERGSQVVPVLCAARCFTSRFELENTHRHRQSHHRNLIGRVA